MDNLCIPTSRGYLILKMHDILYCEAQNTYTIFHLKNAEQIISTRSLMDYERSFEGLSFLRVHKSWMINMDHLREYRKGEGGVAILTNGSEIDVSRRRKESFISYLKVKFKI